MDPIIYLGAAGVTALVPLVVRIRAIQQRLHSLDRVDDKANQRATARRLGW